MIIKVFQLEKVVKDFDQFLSLLLYGPNEGLIREQIDQIIEKYLNFNEYEKIIFNAKELDGDSQALDDILRTVSMFHEKKLIIVESLKDKHLEVIKDICNNPPKNIFIIFKSENLIKSSKIRNFFENDKQCLALACYEDDKRSIMKTIENFIADNQLKLGRDVKDYLLQSLSVDRMVSKHELEKIKLYYKDKKTNLELDEVRNLLNDSSSKDLSKMNESVMYGNTSMSSLIINKLLSEGSNPISLIRGLINYIQRIQITKIEMIKGNSFDNAIKILKPPVFWKNKDSFQDHCLRWPLRSIEKILYNLVEAEIACKLNSQTSKINCEKTILIIASNGRKYFNN